MGALLCYSQKRSLSPLDFGLLSAKSGIDRFKLLQKCHQEAIERKMEVSYKGIDTLNIEIPHNASSIPLSSFTDFTGTVINVVNQSKNIYLFELNQEDMSIDITWSNIDKKEFPIRNGEYMIIINDLEPWVQNRIGYDYSHYRKDLLYVKKGKLKNKMITSYRTNKSNIQFKTFNIDNSQTKIIKNLILNRARGNTYQTYLFFINNQCRVKLDNIIIHTPENNLYGDAAIRITNCGLVDIKNTIIDGTYSQRDKYGYGIYMDNVWNISFRNLKADAKWGIFGTNNVNDVKLEDCDINRFDIHCYGRDVKAVRCKFSNLYNQFSSVFGTISFEKCEFTNFIPFLIESSYNAYTPFDVKWKDCTFNLDDKHNYIMTLFGVPEQYNERPELRRKCLPNISITNCKVRLADNMNKWYLIHTGGVKYKDTFDYISEITLKGVKVYNSKGKDFELSTEKLKYTNPVKTDIKLKCVK